MRALLLLLACLPGAALAASAAALPSHFGDQVEAALTCRSEFSTVYWQDYFRQYLKAPLRTWGDADWFDAQGALLGGVPAKEVFAGVRSSGALMVGALFEQSVDKVRPQIEQTMGITFTELPGPYPRFLSPFGSVLVGTTDQQTKWYCARWHLGNRP
ncbi:hypothetical protein ACTSKR_15160 [Chitinibacteraceae bacterium HSL-7]